MGARRFRGAIGWATAGRLGRTPDESRRRPVISLILLWLAVVVPLPLPATAARAEGSLTEARVKLLPSDGTPFGHIGNHVAVSGDTAVVGAPKMHQSAFTGVGAAYVFTRVGEAWTEQAKLMPSDGLPGDRFGWSVDISGDTIVVSALWDDVGPYVDQGSAYVFTRTAGSWIEQAKLTSSDGSGQDQFGMSVAVSGDDVIVGATSFAEAAAEVPVQGSAYVFTRAGGSWTQREKLVTSDHAKADGYGMRVGIDGDSAVVGATRGAGGQGSAFVYTRTDGDWSQQQELTASGADEFGFWLDIDGDTIVVGAPAGETGGSTYVFTWTGGEWTEQQRLTASDATGKADNPRDGDYFGRSVAVSGDTIVVGAQFDDIGTQTNGQGSAYVFQRRANMWLETAHLVAFDGVEGDLFGVCVDVSGHTAVVGASFKTQGGAQGAAYVWRDPGRRSSASSAPLPRPQPPNGPTDARSATLPTVS